jgi:hypothetical protein
MKFVTQFMRFIYKIRLWLILCPLIVAAYMIYKTRGMQGEYRVSSGVYTGIITGYNVIAASPTDGSLHPDQTNSLIEDLENIIVSESTLRNVSIRLFARCMINGNPYRDTKYITAADYREIYNRVAHPLDHSNILQLIDKSSEDKTVNNLLAYESNNKNNFIYGLLYYYHPLFSLNALKNIKVERINESDMIQITYDCSDPGVAYNTLDILDKEFIAQYQQLRFGQTDSVIKFFKQEVRRMDSILHCNEDTLINYNIKNKVINYEEETKQLALSKGAYDDNYYVVLQNYASSQAAMKEYERRMGNQGDVIKRHSLFLAKLQEVANLQYLISQHDLISGSNDDPNITIYRRKLKKAEQDLKAYTQQLSEMKYGKEGISRDPLVNSWLEQLINCKKYAAELAVMGEHKQEIDKQYIKFAPVGSELKRKERNIDMFQQDYLSAQSALNAATLQRENMVMTSATLKVINPAEYPITSEPTKRKFIVVSAAGATLLFVFSFLLLWELFDRTLKDHDKAERITKEKVFAAIPAGGDISRRRYGRLCYEMAFRNLTNSIFSSQDFNKPYVINILSTQEKDGKSFVSSWLATCLAQQGLKVKTLSYHKDYDVNSRDFLLAETTDELGDFDDADVVLIEYPSLSVNFTSARLLKDASCNLLIARSSRSWTSVDKLCLSKLKERVNNNKIKFVLNAAQKYSVEHFTGQLPPYSFFKNIKYQFSNFALSNLGDVIRLSRKKKG